VFPYPVSAQELRPGRLRLARVGSTPARRRIRHTRARRDGIKAGQLALDPAVTADGVVAGAAPQPRAEPEQLDFLGRGTTDTTDFILRPDEGRRTQVE
jgi:hypothetical protein